MFSLQIIKVEYESDLKKKKNNLPCLMKGLGLFLVDFFN